MKKYIITIVSATTLLTQSLLCGDSKYERLLTDIETQNVSRLNRDLQDDEYLTLEWYEQLIDEAREIHVTLQKMLSILSDYRDFWAVALYAPLTLVSGLYCIEMIYASMFKKYGDTGLISNRRIRYSETKFSLSLAVGSGILTGLFWGVTRMGYKLTYGRIPVENALAIVQALEKARDAKSKLKASREMTI